jgi:hypothetical protein
MNSELVEYLRKGHPNVLKAIHSFPCGDGWFEIINTLCATLEHYDHNRSKKTDYCPVEVTDVKEKWGQLAFYNLGGNDYTDGAIELAAEMSLITCDRCGASGRLRKRSWMQCLCDECDSSDDVSIERNEKLVERLLRDYQYKEPVT